MASRGTRSCSSSSVACTRGSAWNRVHEDVVAEHVGERDQRHALMVSEEGADHDGRGLPSRRRRRRWLDRAAVVDRLVEAEPAVQALAREPLEIPRRGRRIDQARQRRGVRRDDEIVGEPALQPEARHAERLVLIVAGAIGEGVRRLRNAPRDAALAVRSRSAGARSHGSSGRAACPGRSASAAAASGTRTSCRPTTSAWRGRRCS